MYDDAAAADVDEENERVGVEGMHGTIGHEAAATSTTATFDVCLGFVSFR